MDARRISITLDLEVDGESLVGRAASGSGADREFCGWLGLMSALDALVAEAPGPASRTPRHQDGAAAARAVERRSR